MFEWKDDYAVGIKTIDAQHQTPFDTRRKLYAAKAINPRGLETESPG